MQLEAIAISVEGPHATVLRPTDLQARSGDVCVVEGPPGAGHTALSLVLGGRLRPDGGKVLVDGARAAQTLRESVALVDVPDVSEPDEVLKLSTIVAEELAMAGRPAGQRAVRTWLDRHDADAWHGTRMEEVPGAVRVMMLAELAALRPGTEALVICCPDRYGTSADDAYAVAERLAQRHLIVILQLMATTARVLENDRFALGSAGEEVVA
ncbi:hypothetical protein [Aeromicrobium camelliae]|uniref:hypothetical protein n=1 Tax=Aeromicrobium camelliae TaxID=1538144 RepID=UPI00140E58CE|nr:hypothetical protein [Aeromicrobium camelliae]